MSNYDHDLRMKSAFRIYKKGASVHDIALVANVSQTTIFKWIMYVQGLVHTTPITATSTLQEDLKTINNDRQYSLLKRVFRNLKRYKYNDKLETLTYEELSKLKYSELKWMRNIGERSIEELRKLFILKGIDNTLLY